MLSLSNRPDSVRVSVSFNPAKLFFLSNESVRHSSVDIISSRNSLPKSFGNARFVCSAHDITTVRGAIKVVFLRTNLRLVKKSIYGHLLLFTRGG